MSIDGFCVVLKRRFRGSKTANCSVGKLAIPNAKFRLDALAPRFIFRLAMFRRFQNSDATKHI